MVKNPVYQVALLRDYAERIGWGAAVRLRLSDLKVRLGLHTASSIELRLKNVTYPMQMRTNSSDREVLEYIFVRNEYEPIALRKPKIIIDLGAYVGYSSAYFLSKYASATVVALEPDPSNYTICCRNLESFGSRARVVHGAVWPECTKLALCRGAHGDGREWAAQVRATSETLRSSAEIDGYDIPSLISPFGGTEIDLLKIDIERSELELFSRNTESWLPQVRNVCIELHGRDCEKAFFQALSTYSYDLSQTRELTVCRNLRVRH